MSDAIITIAILVFIYFMWGTDKPKPAPAKPETLTCVRVKEVTPAGTINYLCEVKNAKPQ